MAPGRDRELGEESFDIGASASAGSSSSSPLDELGRSSWSNTLDVEIQRDLLASQLFGSAPVTIDRFVVEKLLGAGASAAVYATRDPLLDRRVAIKVLARPRDGRLDAATARVIREARALAQLSHRNIVSIYEVGQWNGRPFIAMELIEGMTLARWLAGERRSVAQILEVFLQAGRGLAAAHAQGRVHRDFKPANVLVADDGRVVVSDFGLASEARGSLPPPVLAAGSGELPTAAPRRAGEMAERSTDRRAAGELSSDPPGRMTGGFSVGTPAYAAPEQRAGAAAHPSADVYSFAIALVEALLGYHPMPATLPARASRAQLAGAGERAGERAGDRAGDAARPAWQAALRPRVPRRVFGELCAAAELDPQLRTPSLGPLLEALSARAPARRRQRRRMIAVGALALALGLALAIALAGWLGSRGSPPRSVIVEREVAASVFSPEPAPRPLVLASSLQAILATPRASRDERWRQAARSLLLQPVPAEIPCRWPAPPRTQAILGGHIVALDRRGDVHACALRTGEVTRLARGARCIQPDERSALAISLEQGGIEIHYRDGARWAIERAAPPPADLDPAAGTPLAAANLVADLDGYCRFSAAQPRAPHWQPLAYSNALRGSVTSADGRQLTLAPSRTLWFQRSRWQPPRLLASGVTQVRVDAALRRAVLFSGELVLVELETGERLVQQQPPRTARPGLRVELSQDGDVAVAASLDGPLWWWRRGDPRWRVVDMPQQIITGLALSPRGQVALVSENDRLQAVELGTGRRYPLADAQVLRARFLDEDVVVATDATGRVWRWSLAAQRSFVVADHPGTGNLWGLAVSPDGSVIASSSSDKRDGAIRLSSSAPPASPLGSLAPTARPQRALHVAPGAGVHALIFDGERLLAGSNDGVFHIWEWRSLRSLVELALPRLAWVWSAAVARPDGGEPVELIGMGRLVRDARWGGSPVLLARGRALRSVFTAAPSGNTGIDDLAVSPDGRLAVAAASSGELALVDVRSGESRAVRAHVGEARRVRFTADGSRVISIGDDGALRIWELAGEAAEPGTSGASGQSGGRTLQLAGQPYIGHGQLYDLDLRGSVAVVGTSDGYLSAWDLPSQRMIQEYGGHSVGISSVRFDATGRWLVSADLSGRLCLRARDRRECQTALLGHQPGAAIRNARFLPDGRIVTSSDDRTVRLWTPTYDLDDDALALELQRHVFAPAR